MGNEYENITIEHYPGADPRPAPEPTPTPAPEPAPAPEPEPYQPDIDEEQHY